MGWRRSLVVAGCLVAVAAGLSGSAGPGPAIRVLQMNLCHSGLSGCFSAKVVDAAAAVIREDQPDVLSLNEVCESDVAALAGTMTDVHRGTTVVWGFRAAPDRRTGRATQCLNGEDYGVGLVLVLPDGPGYTISGGEYPDQDAGDPEIRVWLCITAPELRACTTHLATFAPVATQQLRYLLGEMGGGTVVIGDMNLREPSVPPGFELTGDGDVQHVAVTDGLAIRSSRSFGMGGTTDHPALLVTLAR